MKERREARELALQVLYAVELCPDSDPEELIVYLMAERGDPEGAAAYARRLIRSVRKNRDEIDALLGRHSANWELKRMAAVDRNILRVAAAELLFSPDVPFRVVIDEAVEIAKRYGSDDSGKFVNGVIDAVHRARSVSPDAT
jgi:N utilization substance protein B